MFWRFGLSSSMRATAPIVMLAVTAGPSPGVAQESAAIDVRYEVFVNSEYEHYLRLLQAAGAVAPYPWSIRSFSQRELDRLVPDVQHPWAARYSVSPDTAVERGWGWVRPQGEVIYNSAFPYGFNDGAVWAGRGATLVYRMGVGFRVGVLSGSFAPQMHWAQNSAFELMPDEDDRFPFADWRHFADDARPPRIDLPQRFGDGAYGRFDLGQSTIRLDLRGATIGLSSANQHWGPAAEQPIVLGSNAPGYLHAFLGTSAPVDLWIGTAHGRIVWGRLEHTPYAPMEVAALPLRGVARFTSGMVATFSPRGISGLELGGTRFFHMDWGSQGPSASQILRPLESLLKVGFADLGSGDDGSDADNQIASVFFRWAYPRSGFEAYGEFARYDHSWDLRDFLLQPDHDSGYVVGVRKVWLTSSARMVAVRGEILNTSIGHIHQVRTPQVPFYGHYALPQGHTHHGQLLGAPAGFGGAGSLLAADWYHPAGRLTAAWRRELRQERGSYWWRPGPERLAPEALDVIHGLSAEALFFRGRWEVTTGLTGAFNLNRNYQSDAFNLNATLQLRAGL